MIDITISARTFEEALKEFATKVGKSILDKEGRPVILMRVPDGVEADDFVSSMKNTIDENNKTFYAVVSSVGKVGNAIPTGKIHTIKGPWPKNDSRKLYVVYQTDKNGYPVEVDAQFIKADAIKTAKERAKKYNRSTIVKHETRPIGVTSVVFEAHPAWKGSNDEDFEHEFRFFGAD